MKKLPILITIPHASIRISKSLKKIVNLNSREIKFKCDLFTNEIFDVKNVWKVEAKFSRIFGDPNGNPKDFDADNPHRNGAFSLKPLSGKNILKKIPNAKKVKLWLKRYHRPFHAKVERIIPKVKFLLDAHSLFSVDKESGKKRKDIVIGNRNYQTCDRKLTQAIAKFWEKRGLSVAINKPFQGRYILEKYCGKQKPRGVQLEIKRKLFLDEKTFQPKKRAIKKFNALICEFVEFLYPLL